MQNKFKNKYRISSARLQTWDYANNGAYFITICTQNRLHFFGTIQNQEMQLSEIGKFAEQYWYEIPNHFPFIELGNFVVMPNHVHGILIIDKMNDDQKVDWQTNINYNGPQTTAQGLNKGIFAMNLGFSKDVLKEKATVALNINDVFNSRVRRYENFIDGQVETDGAMQWRVRQITLSFTYRFNKTKNERENNRPRRGGEDGDGGEYAG
jgi:REP element-mobilizing transposase RayT